jgi:putative FmdB family regulatory protein
MPTYDYECKACGKTFEVFQPISEAPKKKCPACGKSRLERLIGPGAGFIFKGSGFYITDYRSQDYKEKAKAESGGAKEGKEGAAGEKGDRAEKKKEPEKKEPGGKAEKKKSSAAGT